jgi:hypothetical protein
MSAKALHRAYVDIGQRRALALHKTAEMSRRAEIANRSRVGVALLFECFGEAVNVWPAEARAQATKRLGRTKAVLDHGVLLG